jgi:hypothetical protein
MNKLIEEIIKELKLQLFSEDNLDDKTIIAIYPGRFQPMGRHHKDVYDWLAKQFGEKNTYVVTSDKTDPQRSPFNFQEKKKIINKHGIKNVVKVVSPYNPQELLKKFDPQKTVIVYMVGEKDAGRLSGYKRLMKYNKTTSITYKDINNPYAYYVYAPHISYNIPSFGEMSGTNIRKALGDREAKLSELKSRFTDIMGWFDADLFNMIIKKMNTNRGNLKEEINEWFRVLSNMTEVQIQMFFNILKKEYGDTKDLLPLIRKFIKTKTLSKNEKEIFQKQMKDNLKLLGLGAIAAIPIPGTMLLIPVIVQLAKKFNINLLPDVKEEKSKRISVVKREFWDKVFEEVAREDTRQLLTCGGVAGHMTHPFEDMGLTFGDMKEMFRLGLSGEITTTGDPSEKLDGQNLFITFKKGKLYAARNKGDIKSGGMDYKSIQTKFAGRGEIERAFTYAFTDLEQAIQNLTEKQQEKIFKNGTAWMNLEIMYPESANVINYDGAYIVFHGSSLYNKEGIKIEDYPEYAKIIAGMIKQVNADTQKTFSIAKPKKLTIGQSKNFKEKLKYFVNSLTTLQNKMNCTDTDTLGLWHQRWWEKYIETNVKRLGVEIEEKTIEGLVKRWAFYDKSFSLNSKNIPNQEFLNWSKEVDKTKLQDQQKKNVQPFEMLVLKFGAEVLKNVSDVMALNPEKTTQKIRTDVETAIETLSSSTNVDDLKVLNTQLKRIKAAGGIESIVPLEGIVFNFNGKTYKLTGVFAPINQLLGYFKFG